MPWYVALFWICAVALALCAWRWGEWPEQIVAGVNLIAPLATRFLRSPLPYRYQTVELPILAIDLIAVAMILYVALRADRIWPLFATALLGVSMLAHVARAIDPGFGASGYSVAGLATYGVPLALAIGLINTARRGARATSPASSL